MITAIEKDVAFKRIINGPPTTPVLAIRKFNPPKSIAVFRTPTRANLASCQIIGSDFPITFATNMPKTVIKGSIKREIGKNGIILPAFVLRSVGIKKNAVPNPAKKDNNKSFLLTTLIIAENTNLFSLSKLVYDKYMVSLKESFGIGRFPHYYGDIVRVLFFLAGILLLMSLPLLRDLIPVPLYVSIFAILALVFVAGLTNPAQKWLSAVDVVSSAIGFIVFEYYAVLTFSSAEDFFLFLINQTLAALFLFAFYFATKTMRGFLVKERKE